MAAVYPTSIKFYAYLGSTWTDISVYQFGSASAKWGIPRNGPVDFLADTGELRFSLRNATGLFSPDNVSVISPDWKKGCKIRLSIVYDGQTRVWYGAISSLIFEKDNLHQSPSVDVVVSDWMDRAAKYPLDYPDILLEKRSDEAARVIINAMPVAPLEIALANGFYTFPVVFDTVTDYTKARTEFQKIVTSELCYMYIQHKGTLGEKLILENKNSRSTPTAKTIPIATADSDFLLMETSDFLLLETGDKIVLDQSQVFDGNSSTSASGVESYDVSYGDNVINYITFHYIPRTYEIRTTVDSLSFCYTSERNFANADGSQSSYSLSLNAGETKTIYGTWGVNGNVNWFASYFNALPNTHKALITPQYPPTGLDATYSLMSTTTNPALGVDITSDLQFISLITYVDRFELTIKNNNAARGYAWVLLQCAYGGALIDVFPDTISDVWSDLESILANDYQPLNFEMPYQTTLDAGDVFSEILLGDEMLPRTVLNALNFSANKSSYLMNAFMNLDIGDYFPAQNSNRGISGNYFVQSVRFDIEPGSIINFQIGVKER